MKRLLKQLESVVLWWVDFITALVIMAPWTITSSKHFGSFQVVLAAIFGENRSYTGFTWRLKSQIWPSDWNVALYPLEMLISTWVLTCQPYPVKMWRDVSAVFSFPSAPAVSKWDEDHLHLSMVSMLLACMCSLTVLWTIRQTESAIIFPFWRSEISPSHVLFSLSLWWESRWIQRRSEEHFDACERDKTTLFMCRSVELLPELGAKNVYVLCKVTVYFPCVWINNFWNRLSSKGINYVEVFGFKNPNQEISTRLLSFHQQMAPVAQHLSCHPPTWRG